MNKNTMLNETAFLAATVIITVMAIGLLNLLN